jgi:hypothetical protein
MTKKSKIIAIGRSHIVRPAVRQAETSDGPHQKASLVSARPARPEKVSELAPVGPNEDF